MFYQSITHWSWLFGESMLQATLTKKYERFSRNKRSTSKQQIPLLSNVSDEPEYTYKCFCFTAVSSG